MYTNWYTVVNPGPYSAPQDRRRRRSVRARARAPRPRLFKKQQRIEIADELEQQQEEDALSYYSRLNRGIRKEVES